MTVTYDDSRYTYDNAFLTYDGVYVVPTLTGLQFAGSGRLTRGLVALSRTLTGTLPAGTGTLTRFLVPGRLLTGVQGAGTGTLTRIAAHPRFLQGVQLAGIGTLTRSAGVFTRTVRGVQPYARGIVSTVFRWFSYQVPEDSQGTRPEQHVVTQTGHDRDHEYRFSSTGLTRRTDKLQ
jgi:hypothetical protein